LISQKSLTFLSNLGKYHTIATNIKYLIEGVATPTRDEEWSSALKSRKYVRGGL